MSNSSTVPSVHLLQSLANQRMGWADALGEFIDNSLDAGAKKIRVVVTEPAGKRGERKLLVHDDGNGLDELHVLVRLGDRKEHESTKLGRYGIGSKDAAFTIGGPRHKLTARSTFKGRRREMTFSWADVMDRGEWLNAEPTEPVESTNVGTTIIVSPVDKVIPSGKRLDELAARLGYLFSPAIARGCEITLEFGADVRSLVAYRLPAFDGDAIEASASVDGKTVYIKCGLVADGAHNPNPGLTYYHGHRTILGPTASGCGDHSTSRIAGVVRLDAGWQLTKNKDNVSRSTDKLFAEVYKHILPVLKRSEVIAKSKESSAFQRQVEEMLNLAMFGSARGLEVDSKAVRGKGDTHGTVQPKGTGRRHQGAKVIQPGLTFASRKFTHLRFEFVRMDPSLLGEFSDNGVVQLNEDNVFVRSLKSRNNAEAIALLACHFTAHSESRRASLSNTFGIDPNDNDAPKSIFAELVQRLCSQEPANDATSNEAAE